MSYLASVRTKERLRIRPSTPPPSPSPYSTNIKTRSIYVMPSAFQTHKQYNFYFVNIFPENFVSLINLSALKEWLTYTHSQTNNPHYHHSVIPNINDSSLLRIRSLKKTQQNKNKQAHTQIHRQHVYISDSYILHFFLKLGCTPNMGLVSNCV